MRALFLPSDPEAAAELAAAHERELQERMSQLQTALEDLESREHAVSELEAGVERFFRAGSVELDRFQHELAQRAQALERRDRSLGAAEAAVEERRRELGAVELRRAALEHRSAMLAERESELERRADELASLARELQQLGGSAKPEEAVNEPEAHLVLTTDGRYRVVQSEGPPPHVGELVVLEGTSHRCIRLTRSPFPADGRPCAVLERISVPEQVSD